MLGRMRLNELLDVVFRWAHLIAGIMWIGNSMLFNWLDRNLIKPPAGCRFHPRCPHIIKGLCDVEVPPEFEPESEHRVACWLYKP